MSAGLVACTSWRRPEDGPSTPAVIPEGDIADESGTLTPSNPTTLSVWITSAQQAPAPDNKITQLLKDKLGVTLEYEIVDAGQCGPEDRCHARGRSSTPTSSAPAT